ncbi:hypothetical protein [Leucobacter sp. NPDC077196]|uniref:hypothetical protein n=1 Tax=Leucobacter sp. NPDC077196 TaxID=3154959 RepID=UPI0034357F4D
MVRAFYTPTDKRLPRELLNIKKSIADAQRPTGTERERALLKIQEQVSSIQAVVDELQAQQTHTFQAAPIDISTDTPNQYPAATRNLAFPGPAGGGRIATLGLSAEFERVSASGNITIWLEIVQNGVVTWRRSGAFYVGDPASAPPGWASPAINEPIQLKVANAAQANMQIRLYATTFVSQTVTAQMRNIVATLTYGPRL